jgi:hypothetical protein
MADLLARGLRARPDLVSAAIPQPVQPDAAVVAAGGESDFVRGMRSQVTGMGANQLGAEALAAEAAGNMEHAAGLRGRETVLRQRAAATGPRVGRLEDINNLGDAIDWFAGQAGSGLASAGPVLAGAAAGRFLGGRAGMAVGGLVPGYNLSQEEAASTLAADQGVRARMTPAEIQNLSRVQGGLSGALEVVGPGAAIERAVGRGLAARSVGGAAKTLGISAGAEGVTEASQDVLSQTFANAGAGRDLARVDPMQVANAAAGGVAGGATFGAPAAAVDLAGAGVNALEQRAAAGVQGLRDAAEPAVQGVMDLGGQAAEAAQSTGVSLRDQVVSAAQRYGTLDGVLGRTPPPDVIGQGQEAVMSWMEQNDATTRQDVLTRLQGAVENENRPQWMRERSKELLDMMTESDDPRVTAGAATLYRQADELAAKAERLKGMVTDTRDFAKGFVDGVKKNAQMDAASQRITTALSAASGELGQTPEFQEAAPVFAQLFTGKLAKAAQPRVAREFIELYGEEAGSVAADLADVMAREQGADPQRALRQINSVLADADMRRSARTQAVQDYLTNDAMAELEQGVGRAPTAADFGRYASLIADYVDGSMSKERGKNVEAELKQDFGPNFKRVMNLFRALHDRESKNSAVLAAGQDLDAESVEEGVENFEDYDQKAQAASFEKMLDGKGRQFSLAGKTNAQGVAKLFDTREDAQKRFDENISPKYQGLKGTVIRADEYVAETGADPVKFAAQYDERFKAEPADFRQRAQQMREAMQVLRDKFAIQMDPATNEDVEQFSEGEIRGVLAKSKLPVTEAAIGERQAGFSYFNDGGKRFKRQDKPTAAEGYIFVGKTPVKMSALLYAMRGKQQKDSFGGTADAADSAPEKLRTVLAALARLGDSDVLDLSQGVYAYDDSGEKRFLMGGDAKGKLPGKLRLKEQTLGGLYRDAVSEMKTEDAAFWQGEASRIAARRTEREIENSEALAAAKDDLKAAPGKRTASVAAAATQRMRRTPSSAVDAADAREVAKLREQLRDPVGGTQDTDAIDIDKMELDRAQAEIEAAFAEVQKRTKYNKQKSVLDNPRFNAWFGDSKMKRQDGAPLVFYHSSDSMFDTFRKGDGSSSGHAASGLGIFLTPFRETSARYGQHTMPLYVRMERPYIMGLDEFSGFEDVAKARTRSRELQAAGYDGIFVPADKTTIVFEPGQLKSVSNDGNFSLLDPNTKKSAQAARDSFDDAEQAEAYLHKVLGDAIQTEFVKDLGHSGEWEQGDTVNTIRVALNAGPGTLSVAHHEAMHELFSRLTMTSRGDVKEVLLNAAQSPIVTRQLERLLAKDTAALADMRSDPEEKLAYMYQFWAAGELKVGPSTESVFQKIAKLLRRVTGMLSNDLRAEAILEAFHTGSLAEPSSAGKVLDEIMQRGETAKKTIDTMRPLYEKAYSFVMPSHDVLTDTDNPHTNEMAKLFYTPAVNTTSDVSGYLNSVRAKSAEWTNRLADAVEGLDEGELEAARETLSTRNRTTFAPSMKAAGKIDALLRDFHKYMKDAGVDVGFRENYFPRVWDFEKIMSEPEKFAAMLTSKYPDRVTPEQAMGIARSMSQLTGVQQEGKVAEKEGQAGYTPYMQAVNNMKLDFIKDEDAQEFLSKDLVGIMSAYLKQGVRRTEYEARFGESGEKIKDLLEKAYDHDVAKLKSEGKSAEEATKLAEQRADRYANAVHAMEGTIGHDKIGPKWRKFNSWMLTYQNMRLLPLVLFSSMIDPLGMMVRGGSLQNSMKAYQRGVREVLGTWTGKDVRDEATKLAETLGVIERESLLSSLGYVQESMYMDTRAKRWSDTFFKWNGMEAWNRAMRVQSSVAAVEFIKEHAQGKEEHSARWMKELGLDPEQIRKLAKDGDLPLTKGGLEAAGMSEKEAAALEKKLQLAVNQWVDGSMLRPNAAVRPSWSSDPRWALLFHLKQFTYAFHKTFLSRVREEYKHGNTAPMVAMLPFVPVMIASDIMRGLIQNGGELPTHMQGWGVGDYLMHGVQRAGFAGIGQFGIDQMEHPADFAGPVVGQAIDVMSQPAAETVREAIPVASAIKA